MKTLLLVCLLACVFSLGFKTQKQEKLLYHDIRLDGDGNLAPWFSDDPGRSYDHVIGLVWNFWDNMRVDLNGLPYYMNHQVWSPGNNDSRGLGGDQFQMALSSWQLLYAYTGNERVKQNMKFMADYYLSHSLSPANCRWPDLPFPYNTLIYSGLYDGDMVIGPGFLQPDKAGSLGLELVHLYKMTKSDSSIQTIPQRYLQAAIKIGRSLAKHLKSGDENASPLPFKVNAFTGEVGTLRNNDGSGAIVAKAEYTTNWSSTMELFLALQNLDPKNSSKYKKSFNILLKWMKKYPLQTNKWGPFFEDVQGWSDTQINAVTFVRFMLEHQNYFPDWKNQIPKIFNWVYETLGNDDWKEYGVTIVNEQTSFRIPGESHIAREGATELLYSVLSGDETRKASAIRQLNWATYSVDDDGKNRFPQDGIWLTDGYGDYVKHYLRAMDTYPELATDTADHILSSTSVIAEAAYQGQSTLSVYASRKVRDISKVLIYYKTFDDQGTEKIRMSQKPSSILINDKPSNEFRWTPLKTGGVLEVMRTKGTEVIVLE